MSSMERTLAILLGLSVGLVPAISAAQDEDEKSEDEGEEEEEEEEGGDITRESESEDDVDNWSYEGETEKVEEVKEEKPKKLELPPEPKRYGVSGHWFVVEADCSSCETLLGQKLQIEESDVMRQFFDYVEIDSKRTGGSFVYPTSSTKLPLGVTNSSGRVVIWQHVIETGSRLTDTYATVWDMEVKAEDGLLYGRKYSVQAWTEDAYEDWEKGYKAKTSFMDSKKIKSIIALKPVKDLTVEESRFQVGEDARISFIGYAAMVRSDVSQEAIAGEQEKLKAAAEAEKKRVRDQKEFFKKGQGLMDDKEWSDAITAFERARALGLDNLDLLYNLGYSYYKLKDYDSAKKEYEALLSVDPRDTDVRYNLARIFEKEKDFNAAIKEYQAILKFNPDDAAARDRLDIVKAARDMLGG